MGEREDLVYQAKLAEQAERYDGKCEFEGGGERDEPAVTRRRPAR